MIEMEQRLMYQMEECLTALQAGESLQSCLARYPEIARELAPLLEIALALETLPQPGPSVAVTHRAKRQFLAAVEQRRAPRGAGRFSVWLASFVTGIASRLAVPAWLAPVRTLATAALALALVLLIGGGILRAADGSLPGEPLYGFKLLGEDIQRALAFGQDDRIDLEDAFTTRRQREVEELLVLGRSAQVTFGGMLQERNGGNWLVEGIPVVVTAETWAQAAPTGQVYVEIHGLTQADGSVLAQQIEIKGDEIIGRVEVVTPDWWQVAGRQVQIEETTWVEEGIRVEDCVAVNTRRFPGGVQLALEIRLSARCYDDLREGTTPDLKQTPPASTPSPTATPDPTGTATPDATPTASPALSATATPTPTPTPTASRTPTSVPQEDATETQEPTPTTQPEPAPTSTPAPAPTAEEQEGDSNENGGDVGGDDDAQDNENDNGANNDQDNGDDGGGSGEGGGDDGNANADGSENDDGESPDE